MKRLNPVLMSMLMLAFIATFGRATLLPSLQLEDLVGQSRSVVAGTVLSVHSAWTSDGQAIETTYAVLVDDAAKSGAAGEQIVIRAMGGEVGDTGLHIAGIPRLGRNERVILFLASQVDDFCDFTGWQQGVLRVREDDYGVPRVFDAMGSLVVGIEDGRLLRSTPNTESALVDLEMAGNELGHVATPPPMAPMDGLEPSALMDAVRAIASRQTVEGYFPRSDAQ